MGLRSQHRASLSQREDTVSKSNEHRRAVWIHQTLSSRYPTLERPHETINRMNKSLNTMTRLLNLVFEVLDYAIAYRGNDKDTIPSSLWDIIEAAHSAIADYLDSLEDEMES